MPPLPLLFLLVFFENKPLDELNVFKFDDLPDLPDSISSSKEE